MPKELKKEKFKAVDVAVRFTDRKHTINTPPYPSPREGEGKGSGGCHGRYKIKNHQNITSDKDEIF